MWQTRVGQRLLFFVLFFAVAVGGAFFHDVLQTRDTVTLETEQRVIHYTQTAATIEALKKARAEKPYTVVLVGDIMLDRGVEASVHNTYDGLFSGIFDGVRQVLTDADVAFGNLEGPISDQGVDGGKAYSFRFDPVTASALKDAGFDVLAVANNHALDWGREALCDTTERLKKEHIYPVGGGCTIESAREPAFFKLGDTRIAFVAFTDFDTWGTATPMLPGLASFDARLLSEQIRTLKKEQSVDIVFVSIHWGDEYETRSHEKQQTLGQQLIDAGADVIVGHHPHVVQEIERYGNGWIIYSLGNFIFDQYFSPETMQGMLAEVSIQKNRVVDIAPRTVFLDDTFAPHIGE